MLLGTDAMVKDDVAIGSGLILGDHTRTRRMDLCTYTNLRQASSYGVPFCTR